MSDLTSIEALTVLRHLIEDRGPDTLNRHWGRKQFNHLLQCCDIIEAEITTEDVNVSTLNTDGLLRLVAEEPLEDMEDIDTIRDMWLTAENIASRLRGVLTEAGMWWKP